VAMPTKRADVENEKQYEALKTHAAAKKRSTS
jgi:hypothetical protein